MLDESVSKITAGVATGTGIQDVFSSFMNDSERALLLDGPTPLVIQALFESAK